MKILEKAILIATNAHAGQFDKGGMPYILHPLAVMEMMRKDGYGEHALAVAILHDVLEDTKVTEQDLYDADIPYSVIKAVVALTKVKGQDYENYLYQIKENNMAVQVKMYDLRHNSDLTRLKGVTQKDLDRLVKYAKAYNSLKDYQ